MDLAACVRVAVSSAVQRNVNDSLDGKLIVNITNRGIGDETPSSTKHPCVGICMDDDIRHEQCAIL